MADPRKVSVTSDDFRKPKEAEAINFNLNEHPDVTALALVVPGDLSTREYQIGDKLVFEVVGITRRVVEGVRVQ